MDVFLSIIAVVCFVVLVMFGFADFDVVSSLAAVALMGVVFVYLDVPVGVFLFYLSFSFPGYLTVGVLWSLFKWVNFLRECKKAYDSTELGRSVYVSTWMVTKYADQDPALVRPSANRFKEEIMGWIILWPFSLVKSLVKFIIGDSVKYVYESIRSAYDDIAKRIFSE